DNDRQPVELAEAKLHRIGGAGLVARIAQPIGIAALVTELQRIDRHRWHRDVKPGLVIEHRLHARGGTHTHVVLRARNDERIGLDILVKNELPGFRALDPEVLRRIAAIEEAANLRPDDVGYPVHRGSVLVPCHHNVTMVGRKNTLPWLLSWLLPWAGGKLQ